MSREHVLAAVGIGAVGVILLLLNSKNANLPPSPPPSGTTCTSDNNCPVGYSCVHGLCQTIQQPPVTQADFNQVPIALLTAGQVNNLRWTVRNCQGDPNIYSWDVIVLDFNAIRNDAVANNTLANTLGWWICNHPLPPDAGSKYAWLPTPEPCPSSLYLPDVPYYQAPPCPNSR